MSETDLGRWTLTSPDGQTMTYGRTLLGLIGNLLYCEYLRRRYPEAFRD